MVDQPKTKTKTIKVDYLARVEGEGSLHITTNGQELADVKLKIFEPPRFFEAFLINRSYSEAPDITARICGICPIAYQMSAVKAIERAFAIDISPRVQALRRLLYCGEWIESHALHIFMLHAPDFLQLPDAIAMAQNHKEWLEGGLAIKKAGNHILSLLGGREVHPINVKVGGFYRIPRHGWSELLEELNRASSTAIKALDWISSFSYPDIQMDYQFVALKHSTEYPMFDGTLTISDGTQVEDAAFDEHFEEVHVPHSNALHCQRKDGSSYLTGPLARFYHNRERLPGPIQILAKRYGLDGPCLNPYRSIQVRMIELIYAINEAIRLIEGDSFDGRPIQNEAFQPRQAEGWGITEAPRGILYHHYRFKPDGMISYCKIVPPTSQNQKRIEDDLRQVIQKHLALPDDGLRHLCEQTIRNYDPCISCATHFLRLSRESL